MKQTSFLKKYVNNKPIEIKHNVKTDAIKVNENYARFQKNMVIYERLKKMRKPVNPNLKMKDSKNNHMCGFYVNRKKEAKRIDEDNKKIHKRMQVLKTK